MAIRTGVDDVTTAFAFITGVVFLTDLALRAKNSSDSNKRHTEIMSLLARIDKKLK